MKKVCCVLVLLLAAMGVVVFGSAEAEAKTFLSIATGGVAGVYYPLGGGLAQVMSKYVPDVEVTAESSNASGANINLIGNHEVAIAFVQNDVAYSAIRGEKPFEKPIENLKMITALYPEHVHCLTLQSTGIKSLADLKGRKVSVGAPGSGVEASVSLILNSAGITYDDFSVDFQDYAQSSERLQDGQLDAGFLVTGYPTSAVMALAAQKDIDLVSLEDGFMTEVIKKYPFFVKDTIPAGAYQGVDHDTATLAVVATLACDGDLPDELVYNLTKAIYEHLDELRPIHEKANLIALEKAMDGKSIPVHPGAAKYYEEKGIKIPE